MNIRRCEYIYYKLGKVEYVDTFCFIRIEAYELATRPTFVLVKIIENIIKIPQG